MTDELTDQQTWYIVEIVVAISAPLIAFTIAILFKMLVTLGQRTYDLVQRVSALEGYKEGYDDGVMNTSVEELSDDK